MTPTYIPTYVLHDSDETGNKDEHDKAGKSYMMLDLAAHSTHHHRPLPSTAALAYPIFM